MWYDVGGGESGFVIVDLMDFNIVWFSVLGCGVFGGVVVCYNEKIG